MNWRWIVPMLVGFVCLDTLLGFVAYNTNTWNLDHTKVITGWAAVREICLVFAPVVGGGLLLTSVLVILAIDWATRPRRRR